MKRDSKLFEIKNMKHHEDIIIQTQEYAQVNICGVSFRKDIISRIKVFRWDGIDSDRKDGPCIFVELYMGNLEVCVKIFDSDVVLDVEQNSVSNIVESYWIHEARDYDYPAKK